MYDSKVEWDTNINSVGGFKDTMFVTSPFSNTPSANASQGSLTFGNLCHEFAPPSVVVHPTDDGYYVRNRMDMTHRSDDVHELRDEIHGETDDSNNTDAPPSLTSVNGETYIAPSRRSEKFRVKNNGHKQTKEKYTEVPGLKGSEVHVVEHFGVGDVFSAVIHVVLTILFLYLLFVVGLSAVKLGGTFWTEFRTALLHPVVTVRGLFTRTQPTQQTGGKYNNIKTYNELLNNNVKSNVSGNWNDNKYRF